MPTARLENARKVARLSAELLRYRPTTAPAIVAKAVLARSVWGIDVTRFLMVGMYAQRMKRWADSMSYLDELEPVLRTINWQGDGRTLTVDNLITAERCDQMRVPAAPLLAVIGREYSRRPACREMRCAGCLIQF